VQQLDDNGALLGVFPAWEYRDSVVELAPGDRLLLFTDGITEATSSSDEEFGERRLMELARSLVNESASDMQTRLTNGVKTFCNSQLQDDATLIVIGALAVRNGTTEVDSEPLVVRM
jgi:sigma-B regulation protein RsbU (phosphoserine phosphatase)